MPAWIQDHSTRGLGVIWPHPAQGAVARPWGEVGSRCWGLHEGLLLWRAPDGIDWWCFFSADDVVVFGFPGYTLMHPSLTRPYLMTEPPLHTDIIHYENIPGFPVVRDNILRWVRVKGQGAMRGGISPVSIDYGNSRQTSNVVRCFHPLSLS